jgi:hypothetical protein
LPEAGGRSRKHCRKTFPTDIPWEWPLYRLPETTVGKLAATMKDKLKANVVRVVGNPDMKVTRVGFACGAPGSWTQIKILQSDNVEVLLAGELAGHKPRWLNASQGPGNGSQVIGMRMIRVWLGAR